MIKPASLWAFLKETEDIILVGRVCSTLAGHDVSPPLNSTEIVIVRMIVKDSEWMNERVEEQKEKWRKRQANHRKKNVTECHGDIDMSRDVTVTNACHAPSVHPSVRPSVHPTLSNESVCNTRPRGDVPDEKTVITTATTIMGVPEAFARCWYREMIARDWTTTDGKLIGNLNWRAQLKAWHNRAKPEELATINQEEVERRKAKPKKLKLEDWALCAERCGKWLDGRCIAGCIMPPQLRPHPVPPEECQGFTGVMITDTKEVCE